MSARKVASKQTRFKDKEKLKSLIQNVHQHWPDVPINEELLQNPTTSFVKTFYARFYYEFERIKNNIRTNILQQDANIDQSIQNDEIDLAIKLKQVCEKLGMNFNLNDMFEPQPIRTILYFTCLMNVIIYLNSNSDYTTDIAECVEKNKYFEQMKESKENLLQELNLLNAQGVQLQHNITELHQNIEHLSKDHKDAILQKAERKFRYQQDYKQINKLKDDIKSADANLDNLREESSILQGNIVSENDVEQLRTEINNVSKELDDLDLNRSRITASVENQEEKMKYFQRCLASIRNSVFTMENLDRLKSHLDHFKNLHQQLKQFDSQRILKQAELENLQKEYSSYEKNLQKVQKDFEDLDKDTDKILSTLRYDSDILVLKAKEDEKIWKSLETEVRDLEEIISSLKEEIALIRNHFSAKYSELINKQEIIFRRYNEALLAISEAQNRNRKT